jgi:hypothetical protein
LVGSSPRVRNIELLGAQDIRSWAARHNLVLRATLVQQMNEPKRHHLVPQFYLQRFGLNNKVELVYREDLNRSIVLEVENALFERDFYTIDTDEGRDTSVERMFGTHVEGPAARALARVVEEKRPVSLPGLRGAISTFLAFQFVRGASVRRAQVEFFKAQARKMASLATPEMVQTELLRQGDRISYEEAEGIVSFAQGGKYEIEVSHQANLHLGSALNAALELIPLFANRKWILLEFGTPTLVTGDEPIALVGDSLSPGEALGVYNAPEIVFPTDPRHALVMVRPDRLSEDSVSSGNERMANVINRHVAFNCHRFVVRQPGTDPLRDLAIPAKAAPVVVVGDYIIAQPRVSVQARAAFLRRHRMRG